MSKSEEVKAALEATVHADGIDGEEMYYRRLGVDAFNRLVDNVMADMRAAAVEERS